MFSRHIGVLAAAISTAALMKTAHAGDGAIAWRAIPFIPGADGTHIIEGDTLRLSLKGEGRYGVWRDEAFGGNFEAIATGRLVEGDACGLMLLKQKDGRPDPNSYLAVEQTVLDDGRNAVRVYAQRDGVTMVEKWWEKKQEYFEYVLDDEEFGHEATALRILRDDPSSCLRFAYKYAREIDGERVEGWMEFPTLADWDRQAYYVCVYVRSRDGGPAGAEFTKVTARSTRADDVSDSETGFGARRRDYTFSGVTGDAVVVSFGEEFAFHETAKFVFWSEANYIPWWHIDETCALSYEFCEIWNGGITFRGETPGGCCEPMSDRLLRWSNVEILESNAARVVVSWRYMLVNPEYQWWGRHPTKRPLVEETFYFYPDGDGVRVLTFHPVTDVEYENGWNEISEPMLIHRGGTRPGDALSRTPLTMINLEGESDDYSYLTDEGQLIKEETKFGSEAIVRINLNNRPAVYEVFAQSDETHDRTFPLQYKDWWGGYKNDWHTKMKGKYQYEGDFWPFAHWPISKMPYGSPTKTMSRWLREPGHTSVMSVPGHAKATEPTTWAMLVGLATPRDDREIREKTSSWLYPGKVEVMTDDARFVENDYYQRALVFGVGDGARKLEFAVDPGARSSTAINPVFRIANWSGGAIALAIDGARVADTDYKYTNIGDGAVIWVRKRFTDRVVFAVEAVR